MDHPEYQVTVARFVREQGLEAELPVRLLDLASETGELAKAWLSGTRYDQQPFQAGQEWSAELGDVFFSLICLANSSGVNLDAVLTAALDRYQARLSESGDAGSGK